MKSKRSRTYLVSGLTLALIFVAIILVFRDVLPDIVKDLSTVPFWGVLLLLALGFAYEAMESVLCLVIIHHKKPDCTFIDALRVTFLGVFGNITTLGAGTLPMQSFYLVIALTLLYTWDKVLKLVLMLLGKFPHTPKWDERREKWANSLTELNREAKKVLLVPSIRVKGIAVSLVKLFVLYSIPYAALRLVGCTALNFAQAQLLASLMLLITSALPNVAGVGPMEFAFLLLFAPWADTAIASSALVLYRVATYFFPFLLSVIVFLREEKKSLKGFDAQSA